MIIAYDYGLFFKAEIPPIKQNVYPCCVHAKSNTLEQLQAELEGPRICQLLNYKRKMIRRVSDHPITFRPKYMFLSM